MCQRHFLRKSLKSCIVNIHVWSSSSVVFACVVMRLLAPSPVERRDAIGWNGPGTHGDATLAMLCWRCYIGHATLAMLCDATLVMLRWPCYAMLRWRCYVGHAMRCYVGDATLAMLHWRCYVLLYEINSSWKVLSKKHKH